MSDPWAADLGADRAPLEEQELERQRELAEQALALRPRLAIRAGNHSEDQSNRIAREFQPRIADSLIVHSCPPDLIPGRGASLHLRTQARAGCFLILRVWVVEVATWFQNTFAHWPDSVGVQAAPTLITRGTQTEA